MKKVFFGLQEGPPYTAYTFLLQHLYSLQNTELKMIINKISFFAAKENIREFFMLFLDFFCGFVYFKVCFYVAVDVGVQL